MARTHKYRAGLGERLGRVPARLARPGVDANNVRTAWIHAVSVGEVLAVSRLVEELRRDFDAVYISTTTATGQKLARERFGERCVFYFPLDLGFAVRAYLRALRPQLVVLAETEFWPNFLRLAKKSGAKVAVVNARISDRSLPGYRRNAWFIRPVLKNVGLFLAQTEEDAGRLRAIGAPEGRVQVGGNLKFDITAPTQERLLSELRAAVVAGAPCIVFGSASDGECELALMELFPEVREVSPDATMVLAPRHPERFDEQFRGIIFDAFSIVRRSAWKGEALGGSVLLLDTVGELAAVYALATVAIVGGSIVAHGGHNILEPAQHGVPIVTGPFTENFRDIVGLFREGKGLRVATAEKLTSEVVALLCDPATREALGSGARAVFLQHAGATERTRDALRALLRPGARVADESDEHAEARA